MEENKEITYFDTEPELNIIQKIVGGYFTIIPMTDKRLMLVNEEGELKKLPTNEEATKIMGYPIYGNVLIVKN
ncbi:Domain of unknown function (DUF3846) [seawater metagenome]|uniref:DUF3846 domain-containing protein n=1 Tax=seawater metagenome TaxID=1561972 RepID=A0A5E8CLP3_9ZZZZ